jgi:hypothetical protein
VEFCVVVLLKVSEVEERLHVGSVELVSPVGREVTAQVSVTVPVNDVPGSTVMVSVPGDPEDAVILPLLESEKPVVVLLFCACQKSPQPAISAAAAINPAQLAILITAPYAALWPRRRSSSRLQANPCRVPHPLGL